MPAPQHKATADDLRDLYGEDSHWEVIHGELLEKPMHPVEHSMMQGRLMGPIGRRFGRKPGGKWPGGWWFAYELHVQYEAHEVLCHDLCGYRRELRADLPNVWPTHVRPDWVCEVLSPGYKKRNRIDKFQLLFRAGVPHYWLVDPIERLLEVYRWTPTGYQVALTTSSGAVIRAEPFDAVELRTAVFFDDEDDDE